MAQLLVAIVGVRGSGKSTLLSALHQYTLCKVVRPSTTRTKRDTDENEYHHYDAEAWQSLRLAWEIEVGGHKYGVEERELNAVPSGLAAVTPFAPQSLGVLKAYAEANHGCEVVTIGLDTVKNIPHQRQRVGNDQRRLEDCQKWMETHHVVKDCDIVLRGSQEIVADAAKTAIRLLLHRGIVDKRAILSMTNAGNLLTDSCAANVQSASYDLRLGGDAWCQGRIHRFSRKNPVLALPPYSYALVQAKEEACLPRFVAGRFDLTVSLFLRGVILSNGPQVDPGYSGSLFCLLYNGSGAPIGLRRGDHFATIEFLCTSRVTEGYGQHYQFKKRLEEVMSADVMVGRGARLNETVQRLERKVASQSTIVVGISITIASILFAIGTWWLSGAEQRVREAEQRIEHATAQALETISKAADDR